MGCIVLKNYSVPPEEGNFSPLEQMYSYVFLTQFLGGGLGGERVEKRCFILLNALGLMLSFHFIWVTTFCFGKLLSYNHKQCLSKKQVSLHSLSVGRKGKERKTACFNPFTGWPTVHKCLNPPKAIQASFPYVPASTVALGLSILLRSHR